MNTPWTRAADGLPRRAFSVADVRRMVDSGIVDEREKVELIEGEFVVAAAKEYAPRRSRPSSTGYARA